MHLREQTLLWPLALTLLASGLEAQAPPRPQPYCVRGVSLDRAGASKGTLVLRDGRIEAILDVTAPPPPGTRVVEGEGLLCLPAFLDAFSRQGVTLPVPVKDQDIPPNEQADVGIDMRLANRKGIQPAFRAVEALAVSREQAEAWRKSGFGAALLAPGGELLAGSSALASTREAAMRDVVLREDVFLHGAFSASGPGYPSTFMGYFAQLRQFFLDSQRQIELEERRAAGRPGPRPPFDESLAAGGLLLSGQKGLLVEASTSSDIERWFRLGDEFGLRVGVVGGLEAWRIADLLRWRDTSVILTLAWGKEVEDPRSKAKEEEEEGAQGDAPDETGPVSPAEPSWEYEEPFAVRLERRIEWERARDCALRLHESGVSFAFGTAQEKPAELLARVRQLVAAGLPAEVAESALTSGAAELLGAEGQLGRIAPGYDATFVLWRADPLLEKEASVAWIFIDGFASDYPEEKKKSKGEGPGEGVNASGTWTLEFEVEGEGIKEASLVLEMAEDGSLEGHIEVEDPMGGGRVESEVDGNLDGDELELRCTLAFGEFVIEAELSATIEGNELSGRGSFKGPWGDEPMTQSFRGKKEPE